MSTFDGHIREFPDIQVDYFRTTQATVARRPLACFLSHVHSDHLVGLETLRSPFVYCSVATRAMLLRLEKFPCRINFAKGILEARQRTYTHLKQLLKPLPLDTPTTLELSPGNCIQVTLLDANHCPGSVMFLFEDDHRAALYTGDTRLEPWFVNALVRSPCLAEYTAGLRIIDTVYLDTTFLERDVTFETQADGLRELLQTVAHYPPDTVFYLRAWTFGYEAVWTALSKALHSKIHVDAYKMRLYAALAADHGEGGGGGLLDPVAAGLVGFVCANAFHAGCLTTDEAHDCPVPVRIHSCEKGQGYCAAMRDASQPAVWIRPVVCRLPYGRGELAEAGAGGGGADLNKEADLEVHGPEEVSRLREMISQSKDLSPEEKENLGLLLSASRLGKRERSSISLNLDVEEESALRQGSGSSRFSTLSLSIGKMKKVAHHGLIEAPRSIDNRIGMKDANHHLRLPRTITFPFSRHSSYAEQCDLIDKLRPRDVWPCTVHPEQWFGRGEPITTIADLFGRFCSGTTFRHDVEVAAKYTFAERTVAGGEDGGPWEIDDSQATSDPGEDAEGFSLPDVDPDEGDERGAPAIHAAAHDLPYFYHGTDNALPTSAADEEDSDAQDSQTTQLSEFAREMRRASHQAAVGNALGAGEWMHIRLASTTDNHTMPDIDLGAD